MRGLARAGFAANGVLHVLIGVIALVIASGGTGEGDQSGALKAVAGAPFGFVALWILAIGLAALGLWYVLEGVLAADAHDGVKGETRTWGRRVSAWGKALVFLALGVLSASVALGARPNSEHAAEGASRTALSVPGGPILLTIVGIAIGIGGVAFIVMGVRRSFRTQMDMPPGVVDSTVSTLGVIGFVCKGLALALVGVLLVIAVFTADPETAGGLDGAATTTLALPGGSWLVGAIGVGFIAYGVFCFVRAKYARL